MNYPIQTISTACYQCEIFTSTIAQLLICHDLLIQCVQFLLFADDYNVPSAALMGLTLTSTQTRACINISIVDDQLVEGNETFTVSLRFSEAPGRDQVFLGKPNTATVTIVDDDGTYYNECMKT